jgi:hypothetical protein
MSSGDAHLGANSSPSSVNTMTGGGDSPWLWLVGFEEIWVWGG